MHIGDFVEVSLNEIRLQGANVRSDLSSANSQEGLHELAENIKINGLLQPIVVRGTKGNPPYDVIVGQRRFLAHQILFQEGSLPEGTIKASFSGQIDDIEALLLSLSENMCRQDMTFEDTSNAVTKLYKYFNNDEYKVRDHTGLSIHLIRTYVKIEEQASQKIKFLLTNGSISPADAKRAINASQGDTNKMDTLIDEIVKLSKYEKKRLVETGVKNPTAKVEDILNEAKQPKLEETIILNLPRKVHKALLVASQKLSIDVEELTINTLINWLKTNDFLID